MDQYDEKARESLLLEVQQDYIAQRKRADAPERRASAEDACGDGKSAPRHGCGHHADLHGAHGCEYPGCACAWSRPAAPAPDAALRARAEAAERERDALRRACDALQEKIYSLVPGTAIVDEVLGIVRAALKETP